MLRVSTVMLLICTWAGTAHAGEHYREVWNPPEARHATHVNQHTAHRPATAHRLSAKRATKSKTSRVTVSALKQAKRQHPARPVSLNAAPRVEALPPLLTPEGNILRVNSRGTRTEVMR
ncbi:hypothetical protein [Trinickia diaoshuihuensis]|uniref:hypothetical protein n=1 Tax=Trinickia diaoshuihuensis TaxID=2292265 RepID=UPI000E224094|nr:hypothetical protein [Trinickia diaoshuihuensis]